MKTPITVPDWRARARQLGDWLAAQWSKLGAPPWHEFGLTATPDHHTIWLSDPQSGPSWSLPTPA